jgi:hypothetical protein
MIWFNNLRELVGFKKEELCLCMVVSEQEGAEIWINDKNTHLTTPKMVSIPKNKEVKVTVKLTGHYENSALVKSSHNLSFYHCELKRIPLKVIYNEDYENAPSF